jgi:rhodanese-related sulfurtransferase
LYEISEKMKIIHTILFAALLVLNTFYSRADTIYQNINVLQANLLIDSSLNEPDFVLIDVRTFSEYSNGHLQGAINMDFYDPAFGNALAALDRNKTYLIYCQSGNRSGQAFTMMQNLNFMTVYNMLGGYATWIANGLPTDMLTASETENVQTEIRIYPNPAFDYLHIHTSSPWSYKIIIRDVSGKVIFIRENAFGITFLATKEMTSGMFLITLEFQDFSETQLLMIHK